MHRRNFITLLVIVVATGVTMKLVHLLLFPDQSIFGISGLGITAVVLLLLNKRWLYPSSPAMPKQMVLRVGLVSGVLGISFTLLFGALLVMLGK